MDAKVMYAALLVWVLLASRLVHAEQPHGKDCGDSETQGDMNACFAASAAKSQDLLDKLILEIRPLIEAPRFAQLTSNMKLFAAFRDAHCKWEESASGGGSIGPTTYWICMDDLNWKYISELKLHLCEGEGMTGSCTESQKYNKPAHAHSSK